MKGASWLPLILTLVVVSTVTFGGLMLLIRAYNNSPDRTTYRRNEAKKALVNHLQQSIEAYNRNNGNYPENLEAIDQGTIEELTYTHIGAHSYSLCATLELLPAYCVSQ